MYFSKKRGFMMHEILRLFPPNLQTAIEDLAGDQWLQLQEIRVRVHQKK